MLVFNSILFFFNSFLVNTSYTNNFDTTLNTGWYYIVDTSSYKRQLDKTQKCFFIDSVPIASTKNFKQLKIYMNKNNEYELIIQLDNSGTKAWSVATEKSIGKKLAFILDNKLLEADFVNSQITAGVTALIRGDYTKAEIEEIKRIIESEK